MFCTDRYFQTIWTHGQIGNSLEIEPIKVVLIYPMTAVLDMGTWRIVATETWQDVSKETLGKSFHTNEQTSSSGGTA